MRLRPVIVILVAQALAGCAVLTPERTPPPETLHTALLAEQGETPFRFWGDEPPPQAPQLSRPTANA